MAYWLFKSEPDCFSIDDLKARPNGIEHWDGVRNFQARNMLRDDIKVGDLVFFYHSSCTPPGIAGIAKIVKEGYPDHTAWDPKNDHYDHRSNPCQPLWYMVDIKFQKKFSKLVSLSELKANPALAKMMINRKGNRLSITPVTSKEWQVILKLISGD